MVAKLAEWGYDLKQTLRRVAVASPNGSAKIETYPQICVIRSSEAGVPAAAADPAAAAAAPADAGAPSFTLLISRNAAPSAVLDAVLADAGAREALKLPGAGLRGLLRLHYREAEAISAAEARGDAAWTAGLSKLAAPAVATLGDAALNDEVLHLYVEMRKADGSWPLGPWWAPGFEPGLSGAADEPAWRKAVKVGSIVDAYDAGLKVSHAMPYRAMPAGREADRKFASPSLVRSSYPCVLHSCCVAFRCRFASSLCFSLTSDAYRTLRNLCITQLTSRNRCITQLTSRGRIAGMAGGGSDRG